MTRIYDYVVAVTKRFPDKSRLTFTDPQLLAHDIKYDIEHNHLFFFSDAACWEHVEARIHNDDFEIALRKLKRNYRTWLRHHPATI